jgi:phage-related protein
MASENVTTKFRVDISDLKKNIAEANRQVKQYRAELANASAGMQKGEETADSLSRKIEAQSKIVEAEKAKLQALKDELSRYESKLSEGESLIADLTRKHQQAAEAFGEDSEEAQKLAKQLDKAREAQERNTNAVENLRTRIIQQDTAVKNAQGQVNQYSDALNNLQKEETETGTAAEKTTNGGLKAFTVALGNLASQAITSVVQGLGDLVRSVVDTGMAFDTSMSKVQAVSGATAEEMSALESKAEELGATTKFTATEAADAFGYMGMAGWKAQDMISGIDGVMNLAAAAGADLAVTSDIVTDSLTAFGKSAADAGRLADIMAAAAANSNTNVEMMGETFKYAAPLAGAMGYSMEDMAVATGLMANSGIKATQAGTSLRAMLTRLSTGSGEAGAAMEKLGIQLDDGHGNMKSLMQVMNELRGSFGDLKMPVAEFQTEMNKLDAALESGEMDEDEFNEAQDELIQKAYGAEGAMKAQYAAMLAGKNGLSGFLAIVNSSDEDFDKLTESIYNSEGAAQSMAETMIDNLEGSLTLLSSAFDGFKKKIYDSFSAPLNDLVKQITAYIMPALTDIANGVSGAESKLADGISNLFSNAMKAAGKLLPKAVSALGAVLSGLGDAIVRQAPEFVDGAVRMLEQITDGILDALPDMVRGQGRIVRSLIDGLAEFLPHFAESIVDALPALTETLFDTLPVILRALTRLAEKIAAKLPELVQKVVQYLPELVQGIADFLAEQTPVLIQSVMSVVTGLVKALPDILRAIVDVLPQIMTAITEVLPELIGGIAEALVECQQPLMEAALQLIKALAEMLPDIVKPITENLPQILGTVADITLQLLPLLLEALDSLVQQVVTALPEILQTLWDALTIMLDPVAQVLANAWLKAEDFLKGTYDEAVRITEEAIEKLAGFFGGIWNSIKEAFGNVGDFFKGVWEEAVQNTETAIGDIVGFFTGIWDRLKKSFTDLGTKIGDAVGGAFKTAINGVLEFIEERINAVPDAINSAIDLINNLPGVEIKPMEHITLPRLAKGGIAEKPTVAQIGENGSEAIIPLEQNKAGLREIAHLLAGEIQNLRAASAPQMTTNNITNQGTTINFTQNNTSPKALSEYDLWRQSQNLMSLVKAQGV